MGSLETIGGQLPQTREQAHALMLLAMSYDRVEIKGLVGSTLLAQVERHHQVTNVFVHANGSREIVVASGHAA